jgi:hypothetical protein
MRNSFGIPTLARLQRLDRCRPAAPCAAGPMDTRVVTDQVLEVLSP